MTPTTRPRVRTLLQTLGLAPTEAPLVMSLEWLTAAAVLILIAGYGIGAPLLLLRTAITVARRRRTALSLESR